MNKELKQKIKNEVKNIANDLEYEEYTFNNIFHSNVEFQKSYLRFRKIFDEYGKEAYLKYVPFKYKKQEINNLIKEKRFLEIYKTYGAHTLHKLEYSSNIVHSEIHTQNRFKLLFIKIKKLLSGRFIALPTQTILALPEKISKIDEIADVEFEQ